MIHFPVSLSPEQAAPLIEDAVVRSGVSTKLIDRYDSSSGEGRSLTVLVFEKYFMRNSSRASLTVTVENLRGETQVRAVGSGGGQGSIFGFDWGAGDSFEGSVENALRDYRRD